MEKYVRVMLPVLLGCFILASCSKSNAAKYCAAWAGNYMFKEEPIPTVTGIDMYMDWDLSISMNHDSCQGILEINGLQTFIKVLTTISGDSNRIDVVYNRYLDGSKEHFNRGDLLFSLIKHDNKLVTRWNTLFPRLSEYAPEECNCFVFSKKKKKAD